MNKSKQKIKNKILRFTKAPKQENTVSVSEVARNLFSDVWKENVDEERTTIGSLQSERLMSISPNRKQILVDNTKGPIRLFGIPQRDE